MTFASLLEQNTDKLKIDKMYKDDPFRNVIPASEEDRQIFGFNLDECVVKLKNVTELRAHLNYIKLKDVTTKCNISKSWFTIGVICEISQKGRKLTYLLSDLKTCRYHAEVTFAASYRKHDVIMIANSFINDKMTILVNDSRNIRRIGTNSSVVKCNHADPNNNKCSVYVDARNGTNCTYHCEQLYKDAGMGRAILKQTITPVDQLVPDAMKEDYNDDLKYVSRDDTKLIKAYTESHRYSRSAKFIAALESKETNKPEIAKGFHAGDMIDI